MRTISTQAGYLGKGISDILIIGIILTIALFVVGALRLYCSLSGRGHDWESFPGDDYFVPAMPDECRRCGARRAVQQMK